MRRRKPPGALSPRPSDSAYVEDWVDPTEPVPTIPANTVRDRRAPQPGEPDEAVPWRLLAEERAEAAWKAWGRSLPPLPEPPERMPLVRTREELSPEARQPREPETVDPGRLVVYPWQGGASCRWRDVQAFLARVP